MKTSINVPASCLHTHTIFCDGQDDIETMCRAAFKQGLCAIGFTSHAPVFEKTGITTNWHMQDQDLNRYIDEVNAARRRWEGKLAVFLGLELDYIKGLRCALDADIQALPLDYLIGSVHYVVPPNGSEPFCVDGPPEELKQGLRLGFDGDGKALMQAYWDAVLEMIGLGGFTILGHVDLVKKNNAEMKLFDSESAAYRERCVEAVQAAAQAGIVVEVNTGGINRGRINETYPSLSLLRLFAKADVPLVITADAHCAAHINGSYDLALRSLAKAGYSGNPIEQDAPNGSAVPPLICTQYTSGHKELLPAGLGEYVFRI